MNRGSRNSKGQSMERVQRGSNLRLAQRALGIDDDVFQAVLELPKNVLSLAVGEPDFPSAPFVNDAAMKAVAAGNTHYAPPQGMLALREEIAAKLRKENGISYDPDEIMVTPGAAAAVTLSILALVDHGDEVLIPDPLWFHYSTLVELAGGTPKRVPLDAGDSYRIRASQIENLASRRTKMLVVNSPSNPTGRVISKDELDAVAESAERLGITVVSDEIYEKIVYPPLAHRSVASLTGMRDRTVVVNGFSKGYAMTGWRVGYAAAPRDLIRRLSSILGYTLLCASSVSQFAAIEALRNPRSKDYTRKMVETWRRRRDVVLRRVEENRPFVSALKPEGTFYAWLDVSRSGMSGKEAAKRILETANVAVLPGYLFGNQGIGHVRVSFATSDSVVEQGMERLCRVLGGVPTRSLGHDR